MTLRERAKVWMLERCPAELTGTRFGAEDVEDTSSDTESGKPCDCLDALTLLLGSIRQQALEDAADLVASTNYYEPNETIASRIRHYDGARKS